MSRSVLRQQLLERRARFASSDEATPANTALALHLATLLGELEPDLLGLYWPHRSEFNAAAALRDDNPLARLPMALPFAHRSPNEMHYRAWNGHAPTLLDECGIPACEGATVVPDVVLVPCVGFTADDFRLGYGGGFFDRWLARHADVISVGVAWSISEIAPGDFEPQSHDRALTLIVTERGIT